MRVIEKELIRPHRDHATGGLRSCGDGRFVGPTREAFEEVTGLASDDYYQFSNAGGAAAPQEGWDLIEDDLMYHGRDVRTFGWQGHLNGCGRYPDASDAEVAREILEGSLRRVARYPEAEHHIIVASLGSDQERPSSRIEIYTPREAKQFLRRSRTTIPVGQGKPRPPKR